MLGARAELEARFGELAAAWWAALAATAGVALVLLLERRSPGGAPGPGPGAAPSADKGEQPIQVALGGPLELFPGHTYFAVVELNGLASAGSASNVKAEAEKLGFRDVAVFTDRPQFWPGSRRGTYYVRGTYRGPQRQQLVKTSGFLWSVVVLDAWVAPL